MKTKEDYYIIFSAYNLLTRAESPVRLLTAAGFVQIFLRRIHVSLAMVDLMQKFDWRIFKIL
ncbi:hypothetical protein MAL08_16290 [Leptospira noguchii]|uniref:hypothetical protein n=1 Tax=Leptospira noguchii TaxID=28182 RepID=UPI001FB5B148|nr:hypothetical protein [Leptospira noguchii]UOG37565.1 hypothetical protein MAL08_16290 [Leptospira noguchii]